MSVRNEVLYSAEQIKVPPEFPDILKNYTKSVLKDQPSDIFLYSIEYFNRLQKARPVTKKLTESQLSALFQKLHRIGGDYTQSISKADMVSVYDVVGASNLHMEDVLRMGSFDESAIPWLQVWCLSLVSCYPDLSSSMAACQRILQKEMKNPIDLLLQIFQYVASKDAYWTADSIQKLILLVKSLNDGQTDINIGKIIKEYN